MPASKSKVTAIVTCAIIVAGAIVIALLALAPGAAADAVFHTEQIPLMAVGTDPLQSGTVVNIHADGPEIYAHEQYILVGAAPNALYQVELNVFPASPSCATANPVVIPTAQVPTNASGNGNGNAVLPPEGIPPSLRGTTVGVLWHVLRAGTVQYQTACIAVALD